MLNDLECYDIWSTTIYRSFGLKIERAALLSEQ